MNNIHKNITKKAFSSEEIEANKKIYDEHFDIDFVKALNEEVFKIIESNYFRPVYIGFDDIPERKSENAPIILASNHSGMAFPWDAMVFGCGIFRQYNYEKNKIFRALTAPMLSGMPFMHPYFMLHAWKKAGGIDASFLNFETMMHSPESHLLIYPEGVPGIGKGYNRRYKLQRFASSFIRMSIKYKTDIIWFSTVNAEFVAPFMYSSRRVNKVFNKVGMPFFPLGPLTLMLLFPFAFFLSFPANMHFIRGSRFSPWKMTNKAYEDLTEDEILELRDRIYAQCQKDLNTAVENHGKSPYHVKSLIKVISKKFPFNTPLGWPFLFHEFERQWKSGRKDVRIYKGWGATFLLMFRNPITFFYFLPILGWIVLLLYGNIKWKRASKAKKP